MNYNKNASPQAVIYCRVSSKSQESEGHGLESQETRCRQHAAAKGYDVAAVFPDTITGGGDFMKRPGMVALLSFLDAQPDERFVVIFDDLKRFARDTKFHLDLREAFRLRGASIECLNFKFEDTPEGEFIETIMAAQGALERKQNGRQVAQKMKARMENGYWVHDAPIGYRYQTIRGRGKVLTPDEPFASIIKQGLEDYASGLLQTQAEVKRFFESFPDFPRNKYGEVRSQRVADILRHPIYTGHICSETYGISWLKAQHDALIPIATYDKIQERLNGIKKLPARKNIGEIFALRGFVCCADCGVPLRSSLSKGRNKYYAYYLCQTKGCESYGKSIARDRIENEVGDIIQSLQPTQSLVTLTKTMFTQAWDIRYAQIANLKSSLKKHINDIDRQIEKLVDRLIETANDHIAKRYETKIDLLERDKTRYADQIMHLGMEKRPNKEDQLEPALKFISNPYKLWDSGNITLRRLVLKLAFADRLHYHRKTGARTANLSMPFKALDAILQAQGGNGGA